MQSQTRHQLDYMDVVGYFIWLESSHGCRNLGKDGEWRELPTKSNGLNIWKPAMEWEKEAAQDF